MGSGVSASTLCHYSPAPAWMQREGVTEDLPVNLLGLIGPGPPDRDRFSTVCRCTSLAGRKGATLLPCCGIDSDSEQKPNV